MLPKIGFKPDIIHCNDWHTGLMGVFLKEDSGMMTSTRESKSSIPFTT